MTDFLDAEEVAAIGFAHVGEGVRISRRAAFFAPERISVGEQTRIDAFCVLSAGEPELRVGRNVHLSVRVTIVGRARVEIGDFATIGVGCTLNSSSDDYTGATMTNPTVPERFRGAADGGIVVGPHAILATGVIIGAGVTIGASAAVGAGSFVKRDVAPFSIVAGAPARVIGVRRSEHLRLAEEFLADRPER